MHVFTVNTCTCVVQKHVFIHNNASYHKDQKQGDVVQVATEAVNDQEAIVQSLSRVAKSDDKAPISPAVEVLIGVIALTLIGFVAYVFHSIQQIQTHYEILVEKILSAMQGLRALNDQNVQHLSIMNNMTLLFFIFVVSIMFGYYLFHKDVAHRKDQKRYEVVRATTEAVSDQEAIVQSLLSEIVVYECNIKHLEKEIKRYETEIAEQREKDAQNEGIIKRLEKEKQEKVEALAEAKANLLMTLRNLDTAEKREDELKKYVKEWERVWRGICGRTSLLKRYAS